jgi:hydrogenase maturation protein HypF
VPGDAERRAARFTVRGAVQGVGFRPFVYRLATELRLGGFVRNAGEGVVIGAEGDPESLERFAERLTAEAPAGAAVEAVTREHARADGARTFVIEGSGGPARPHVRVARDVATCAACRAEVDRPADRRFQHPFASCTDCGPRFSIIRALPYDRPRTSMAPFVMCERCAREYEDPADRRFHAQPIACPRCGPRLTLLDAQGRPGGHDDEALDRAVAMLREGRIVALKGIGGVQLLARADRAEVVSALRTRKRRRGKPLAVMVPSLAAAHRLACIGPEEERLLAAPENPIVLLRARTPSVLAAGIAPRVGTIGLLLPTTPLHHLLLAALDLPVVATSGNVSDVPIAIDERAAVAELAGVADAFLVHDRPIVHRVDDSVARVVDGAPTVLRLARGFAPAPLPALEWPGLPPVLAVGAHQKVALALWTGTQAVLGPHVGDMDGAAARAAFAQSVEQLSTLYQCAAEAIACDQHPDAFTTRWAQASGVRVIAVQHHHAHAAACMAEHGLLDRDVLAVTWDGSGWGPDGTVWGGEILAAGAHHFTRVGSLLPFPLAGGDAAVRQPRRVALALLAATLGPEAALDAAWLRRLGLPAETARALLRMGERGLNSPRTSSMGRLFDGIAALLLGANEVSYEGEAAGWLEAHAGDSAAAAWDIPLLPPGHDGVARLDWRPMIRELVAGVRSGADTHALAARVHATLAEGAAAVVAAHGHDTVVLGGGCFQNARLTALVSRRLCARGRTVFGHHRIPANDGGLAAGQLAVALAHLRAGRG